MTEKEEKICIEGFVPKKMLEKANSEAAAYKRELRKVLDEKQQIQEAHDKINYENKILTYEKHFLMSGYTEEAAKKSAIALWNGDIKTVIQLQQNHEEMLKKVIQDGMSKEMKFLQLKSNLLNEILEKTIMFC